MRAVPTVTSNFASWQADTPTGANIAAYNRAAAAYVTNTGSVTLDLTFRVAYQVNLL